MDHTRSILPSMPEFFEYSSPLSKKSSNFSDEDENQHTQEESDGKFLKNSQEVIYVDVRMNEAQEDTQESLQFKSQSSKSSLQNVYQSNDFTLFGTEGAFYEVNYEEENFEKEKEQEKDEESVYSEGSSKDANWDEAAKDDSRANEQIENAQQKTFGKNSVLDKSDHGCSRSTYFDLKPLNWDRINLEGVSSLPSPSDKVIVLPAFGNHHQTPDSPDQNYDVFDFDQLIRSAQERAESRLMENEMGQHSSNEFNPEVSTGDGSVPASSAGSEAHFHAAKPSSLPTTSEHDETDNEEIDVVSIDSIPNSVPMVALKYAPLFPICHQEKRKNTANESQKKRIKKDDLNSNPPQCVNNIEYRLLKTVGSEKIKCSISPTVLKNRISPKIVLKLMSPQNGQFKEPPLSFTSLVSLCLQSSEDGHMPVHEMYEYIEVTTKKWRNSLRHNLCQTNNFTKTNMKRSMHKGYHWTTIRNRIPHLESEFRRVQISDITELYHAIGSIDVLDDLFSLGLLSSDVVNELINNPKPEA